MRLRLLAGFLLALAATSALAGTYWIDDDKGVNTPACGTGALSSACKSWYYLLTAGCDASGCENNIQADLDSGGTNATVHFTCDTNADGTVCADKGTYFGDGNGKPLCIGFTGQATSELTIDCTNGAGTLQAGSKGDRKCRIDGTGLTYTAGGATMPVLMFGRSSNSCTSADATSYVKLKGFEVVNPPASPAGPMMRLGWSGGAADHIRLQHFDLDGGTTATSDLMIALAGTTFITGVDGWIHNCAPSGTFGCWGFQQPSSHLAFVDWKVGHRRDFPGPYNGGAGSNNDCFTAQGADTVFLSGVECYETADGLDIGMLDASQSKNVIVEYSWIHDIFGNPNSYGSREAKVSGDASTVTNALDYSYVHSLWTAVDPTKWRGGFWVTELGKRIDFRRNTMYGAAHVIDDCTMGYLDINDGGGVADRADEVQWRDNIIDGTTTLKLSGACSCATNQVCPLWFNMATCTASNCKFINNAVWFAERGASAPLIYWLSNGGGAAATFATDLSRIGGGLGFNSTGSNSANVRADPGFLNRGGTTPADYRLTNLSAHFDAGNAFCTASSGDTGTTISVTCTGTSTSPLRYFPKVSDYYALVNADCVSAGPLKSVGDTNPGCFDVKIEGACGTKAITTLDATSLTFSGSCTWANGAMVDRPWLGNAPPRGFNDINASATTTIATTTTTTTSTTTTTLIGPGAPPSGAKKRGWSLR